MYDGDGSAVMFLSNLRRRQAASSRVQRARLEQSPTLWVGAPTRSRWEPTSRSGASRLGCSFPRRVTCSVSGGPWSSGDDAAPTIRNVGADVEYVWSLSHVKALPVRRRRSVPSSRAPSGSRSPSFSRGRRSRRWEYLAGHLCARRGVGARRQAQALCCVQPASSRTRFVAWPRGSACCGDRPDNPDTFCPAATAFARTRRPPSWRFSAPEAWTYGPRW